MRVWIYLLFLILFLGCGESKTERIARMVGERVSNYRTQLQEECRAKALEKASMMVDSMIVAVALQDTTQKYARPTKPVSDSVYLPDRNRPIKPLFDSLH